MRYIDVLICASDTNSASLSLRWRRSKNSRNTITGGRIFNLTVNVNKLNPMYAGCYRIKVSQEIMLKKAIINVKSLDNAQSHRKKCES